MVLGRLPTACGRQDGGVLPGLPALHAACSSTATFFSAYVEHVAAAKAAVEVRVKQ
jgi:hypothetical protein